MLRESDTEWDCLADRSAALDEQKVIYRTCIESIFRWELFFVNSVGSNYFIAKWSCLCARMYARWAI